MPVDVDDPSTWPAEMLAWVRGFAERGESVDEMDIALVEREHELRVLLTRHRLLAYHCTRLLPHEVADIRRRGLRRLSRATIDERIAAAFAHGFLTPRLRDQLLAGTVLDRPRREDRRCRENIIFLTAGLSTLAERPRNVANLLEIWGGEAIYMDHKPGSSVEAQLRQIGVPSIVECACRIRLDEQDWASPLAAAMVGSFRGERRDVSVQVATADIPPSDVLDIWQPGHPDYDRHVGLPRG
ncbi:MAG TPA: hypothetical protein VJU14_10820 [Solirubrobacterales bacterium]|nr:hypothetical protein [Solirubrobacterales bacterium]